MKVLRIKIGMGRCKERVLAWGGPEASSAGGMGTLERKLLHVKQSIDHALNILKAHSHSRPYSLRSGLLLKTQLGV